MSSADLIYNTRVYFASHSCKDNPLPHPVRLDGWEREKDKHSVLNFTLVFFARWRWVFGDALPLGPQRHYIRTHSQRHSHCHACRLLWLWLWLYFISMSYIVVAISYILILYHAQWRAGFVVAIALRLSVINFFYFGCVLFIFAFHFVWCLSISPA